MSSPDNSWMESSAAEPPPPASPETLDVSFSSEPPPSATTGANSRENPIFSGWDVVQVAVMMFLCPVLLFLPLGALARLLFFPKTSWSGLLQQPIVALAAELAGYIVLLLFMVMLVEGKYHESFWTAIEWRWPTRYASLLGLGIVLLFGLQGLAHFLPIPKNVPFDQFFQLRRDAFLTSAFAVSLGPLMEELFFRGFLYPVLARRTGMFLAVVLTALPFGLLHAMQLGFAWGTVLVIFLVGIVLTMVRAVTRSVASSFVVHVAYNSTLMVLTLVATDGFRHMERLNQ